MDFNDTPKEAEFRAQVKAWLAKNAPKFAQSGANVRREEDDSPENIAVAKKWQALKAMAANKRHPRASRAFVSARRRKIRTKTTLSSSGRTRVASTTVPNVDSSLPAGLRAPLRLRTGPSGTKAPATARAARGLTKRIIQAAS